MRQTLIPLMLTLALAAGCNRDQTASSSATTEPQPGVTANAAAKTFTPEELGALGAKIEKSPDRAESLLTEHGLTKESFEKEIRRITEDPAASKRYAAAYEKAKA